MHTDTSVEIRKILDIFLDIELPWKDSFLDQLQNSSYVTESYSNAFFVMFSISPSCNAIKNVPRVPVTVVIDCECLDKTPIIHYGDRPISFSGINSNPIECNLHIVDGYLNEVEVFTLNGAHLNFNTLCEGKRYYFIRE